MADYLADDALNIYTDGSSLQSPRRGGIGIRFVVTDEAGREEIRDYEEPGYRDSTNNEMEIWAAVMALRLVRKRAFPIDVSRHRKIVIRADSRYLCDNYSNALYAWRQHKWTKRSGAPVENVKLWEDLVTEVFKAEPLRVEIQWVPGKSSEHTKAVDKIAKRSAKNPQNDPLTVRRVRRKLSPNSVEVGSVGMESQQLDIRVITDQWSQAQQLHRCKYEVLSEDSPYAGKVDLMWSGDLLDAGHHYRVLVNDQPGNPRIVEVIEELARDKPG